MSKELVVDTYLMVVNGNVEARSRAEDQRKMREHNAEVARTGKGWYILADDPSQTLTVVWEQPK